MPNEAAISQPLFPDCSSYQQFRQACIASMAPELERLQEARRNSEQEAGRRFVR
jgi:hypothetical protein